MTLQEQWYSLLLEANKKHLTQFIFKWEDEYYFTEWYKVSWMEPVKIIEL